jgi:hypothetical protein
MDRLVHRAARAAAAAIAVLLGALSGTASATNNAYCGVLVSNGTWCGDGTAHYYVSNAASYPGTGNVWVCERLLLAGSSTQREPPACAYNYVSQGFGPYGFTTAAEVAHFTGVNHTVNGLAVY